AREREKQIRHGALSHGLPGTPRRRHIVVEQDRRPHALAWLHGIRPEFRIRLLRAQAHPVQLQSSQLHGVPAGIRSIKRAWVVWWNAELVEAHQEPGTEAD